jgi:tetratricopeptide (TPR) repeat protein/transcriptional regulator with XRE-family HTH domain
MDQEMEKTARKEYRRVIPNERLKKARQSRGWSQEELAAKLYVTKKTVERWEYGTAFPHAKKQEELRDLFGMDAAELGLVQSEQRIPSFFHVPHKRNSYFTGRVALLASLYESLVGASEAQLPLALCGLGGIGKTQLAVEYTYRSSKMYQAIFWVRADRYDVLVEDFVDIASILHLPEQNDPNTKRAIHAVKHWFMSHTDWLLVLDNVENLDSISPFLPLNHQGHILLTTRAQAVGTHAEKIDVDKMNLEEGITFLLRRAKKITLAMSVAQADAHQRKLAAKLVRETDGLPLALDQVGAYIEEGGCRIAEYLELYRKRRDLLLKQRGTVNSGHPESVVTTFLLSFERIQRNNQLAADILCFCAYVHPDAIPENLLLADSTDSNVRTYRMKVDPAIFHEAIGELLKYSLVRRLSDEKMLIIHRLVQTVIQDYMQESDQQLWSQVAIGATYETMVASGQKTMYLYHRYIPHAEVCDQWIKRWKLRTPQAAYLLIDLGRYSRRQAFYDQAEQYSQRALQILSQVRPPGDLDIAIAYSNLALAYKEQGKYQQAKSYFQQAMEILTSKSPIEDEVPFALGLSNLASCEMELRDLLEAERHAFQAKTILEKELPPEHPEITYTLTILATIYREQEKFEEAKQLYEKILAICEHQAKPGDDEVAATLNNLATIYIAQDRPTEAEALNQRALESYKKIYGPKHPEVARCLMCLGDSAALQNDWSQAEQYNQQALEILSKTVGTDHHRLIEPLRNIAAYAIHQKEYKKAQQFYKRALNISEKYPDIDIAAIVNEYATLLDLAEQHDAAVGLKAHFGRRLLKQENSKQ